MRPWIIAGLGLFAVLFAAGVLITTLPQRRATADQETCKKNLKDLAAFAAMNADPDPNVAAKAPHEVPPGTIMLPGVEPLERLSWVVGALPTFDQHRQKTTDILEEVNRFQPWAFPRNQSAAKNKLNVLLCPGNPALPEEGKPASTQYVGIAGLGTDAATLNFVPPDPAPPRAGCFRYDLPTPFDSIKDGLSQSLLFGERSNDLGPWLRGGPATLRGLDDAANAPPILPIQFGGNHPDASNWAMADGSVRVFTPRVNPKILFSLATIAGKESEFNPDE